MCTFSRRVVNFRPFFVAVFFGARMTEPERCGHSCSLRLLMKGFKRLWLVLVYVVLWKVLSDQWLIWSHSASTNPDKSAVVEEKGPVILRSPKKAVTTLTNTKHALQTAAQLLDESSNDAFDNFRFYVYDDLPREYTYQGITECIAELYPRNTSNCDFATTLCTQSYSHMARYSKRRFNRNADLVMAKIFSQYRGPLRTYNAHEADLFIVPYPSTGHCECRMRHERCVQDVPEAEVDALIHNLTFFNASTMHRHLFLSSIDYLDTYPYFLNHKMPLITTIGPAKTCELDKPCGKIVIPYANLNPENQPSVITKERFMQKRMYAVSAADGCFIHSF